MRSCSKVKNEMIAPKDISSRRGSRINKMYISYINQKVSCEAIRRSIFYSSIYLTDNTFNQNHDCFEWRKLSNLLKISKTFESIKAEHSSQLSCRREHFVKRKSKNKKNLHKDSMINMSDRPLSTQSITYFAKKFLYA